MEFILLSVFHPIASVNSFYRSFFGLFASVVVAFRFATRNYYLQQLGQSYMSLPEAVNLS